MGKLLFLSIFLASAVNAAEKAGMPQLDTKFWISQIFWLTITFSILFILLSRLILPKISSNLEMRKSKILENISTADKQRVASETKIEEYKEIIKKSKNEAKNYINHSKEKLMKDINLKKKSLEEDLSKEIEKAELEIQELRVKAPERINEIAVEASTNLLHQIIGADVNSSSISAIVNDLSSKKMEKYYGN
tara:strand:- start:662 stop:1237 length:576 start_codon:yes stop_codon:yes gene_type:complete